MKGRSAACRWNGRIVVDCREKLTNGQIDKKKTDPAVTRIKLTNKKKKKTIRVSDQVKNAVCVTEDPCVGFEVNE